MERLQKTSVYLVACSLAVLCALVLCALVPRVAWAASAGTVQEFETLVKDPSVSSIELTADLDFPYPADGFKNYNLSNKSVNLSGFTITATNTAICFVGENFVIQNGTFSGRGGSYALFIGDETTTDNAVIQDVTTQGGINVYNATNVTLRNVNITGTNYYAVWCDEGGQVSIESGTFASNGNAVLAGVAQEKDALMKVQGGTFITNGANSQPLVLKGNYMEPVISGGTFDTNEVVEYVPVDSAALWDGGSISVLDKATVESQTVCAVDGVHYKTAAEASSATGGAPLSYKVTLGGESVAETNVFVADGSLMAAPDPAPSREGYTFLGWFKGDDVWKFDTDTVTGPLVLTAKWEPHIYKVTFNDDIDETADTVVEVKHGESIAKPADPVRKGYTFAGWFSDKAFTQAYDFSAPVTGNLTLYASWTQEGAVQNSTAKALPPTGDTTPIVPLALVCGIVVIGVGASLVYRKDARR